MSVARLLGTLTLLGASASGLYGCAVAAVAGAGTATYIASQDRTTGTVVEDENIEVKAAAALSNDADIREQTHINITSYNNVVLMTGEAPTAELRERAELLVAGIENVRQVYNEIIIAGPSSMGSRSTDTWITTKSKSALLGSPDLAAWDTTRIKVVTERGIVYLLGLLSRQEAEAATETVRRVGGVQRVVRLFEYTD